jgi:hypothetical protein
MTEDSQDPGCPVAASLAPVRAALLADGYHLSVKACRDGALKLAIEAGPEACAECLVPKPLFEAIVRRAVSDVVRIRTVEVTYPVETEG